MKFEPILSLWLSIPYLVLGIVALSWQLWRIRHKPRPLILLWLRRGLLLLLPGIIALGPSVPGGTSSPGVSNLDVIFAVDTTPSMGALDYAGTQERIVGIKQDLMALAAKMPGARLELITFDSDASVILPFTDYATAFSEAVQGLTPQVSSYSQGTAIDKPVSLITQEFKNSQTQYPAHRRLLFYFSDGEQTISTPVGSFAGIAPLIGGGAVLGYGTTAGAKMITSTDLGTAGSTSSYIMTVNPSTSQLVPAISKQVPSALQTIASQLGVQYVDRDQGGPITSVYQASHAPVLIDQSEHIVRYLNLYWLLSIPFAALMFWEWQALLVKLLELRLRHRGQHAK